MTKAVFEKFLGQGKYGDPREFSLKARMNWLGHEFVNSVEYAEHIPLFPLYRRNPCLALPPVLRFLLFLFNFSTATDR